MAAEIGGYVGLLLGASLVNLGQINNFLLDYFFGNVTELTQQQLRKMMKSPFKRMGDRNKIEEQHGFNNRVFHVNQGVKEFY